MVKRDGIGLWDGLREAQRIVGPATITIIGHNIAFDLGFTRKHKLFLQNPSLDTFELASILVPHAGRYSLGALAGELGIKLPATHRALDDARVAHQLYLKVFQRAVEMPREVIDEISKQADLSGWVLGDFWRDVKEEQARGTFSTSIGAAIRSLAPAGRDAGVRGEIARKTARKAQLAAKPLKPKETPTGLDIEQAAHLLATEGPFSKKFPGYEARPQQVDMLRQVVKTFNDGGAAFIEAGTGTGKSLAYLIPSMMWAIQNGERVVISTNTINLQEQLADKDVPAIIDILNQEARAAVMKGKGRYLCPNRFADLRRNGPKTADEARVLTKILIWLPNTLTGDADELFLPSPGERMVFQHLSAQNPICNMNTCNASDCYFHQARRLAESAHVVIVNHALLLADIAVENRALPEYKYLVVDEAHHLEGAATDSLTFQIDREEIQRQITDLGRASTNRKASGVLAEIASKSRQMLKPDQGAAIDSLCDQALQAATGVWTNNSAFFDELQEFLADDAGDAGDYMQRIRLTRALRGRGGWGRVEIAGDKLVRDLNALTKVLNSIFKGLNEMSELIADFDVLASRLNGAIRFFVDAAEQLNGMVLKPQDDKIYWVDIELNRRGNRGPKVVMNVAPLNVGPMMKKQLFEVKNAVVLTSATMRTSGANGKAQPTFDYIKGRLSAQDAVGMAVGSPFDYKNSTLVFLATDIPEPNQQGYQQAVEKGLIELFRASKGRGLALFTSYTQLRATARAIAPVLQREDILVFEQGDGTSRKAMLEGFRAADRAVMLGTRSFWEGVDIQGEKLSALAICKLPFDVPTDPIFAARSETFENAFNDYSVPETVLRFRQGFGRLIRSKSDRGVVAVFDKRVISKMYGAAFLNALPGPTVVRAPLANLGKMVGEWLGNA